MVNFDKLYIIIHFKIVKINDFALIKPFRAVIFSRLMKISQKIPHF